MNKTKRGLMLAGGIVNVVVSSIFILALPSFYLDSILAELYYETGNFMVYWNITQLVLILVLNVITLIISCLLLPNPENKKSRQNFIPPLTTLIVLNFLIFVISNNIFVNIASLVLFVLFILTICIHKEENIYDSELSKTQSQISNTNDNDTKQI